MFNRQFCALVVGICGLGFAGCNGDEGGEASVKKQYEDAIKDLKEPVGLIAAYRPFLNEPVRRKYDKKHRADVLEAMIQAADEVRHAANQGRQAGVRSGSSVSKELAPAMLEVSKICAALEEKTEVDKCAAEVDKLDKALGLAADKAKAAGVAAPFPRVAPESVTEKAKKSVGPYLAANGPGKIEKEYLKKRKDPKVRGDEVLQSCRSASGEAKTVMEGLDGKNDTLHKLAAKHYLLIDSLCNRLSFSLTTYDGVLKCKEDPDAPAPPKPPTKEEKEKAESECRLQCANARKLIHDGVVSAQLEKMKDDFKEICEEYLEKKK